MEVSATILTHNSSKTIANTLTSLKGLATEIIIVDDNSTDNTLDVVRQLEKNAKIFNRSLNSDFAAQRNFSLQQCTNKWVIVIDSDEELTQPLRNNIIAVINSSDSALAYSCKRKNLSFIGSSYNWLERPILQQKNLQYVHAIHERLNEDLTKLDGVLIHNSWLDLEHFMDDINTYSTWKAKMWVSQKREYSIPFVVLRQIAFAVYIFLRRWLIEGRIRAGWKGFIYTLAWSTEELFVALKFIQYKTEHNEK